MKAPNHIAARINRMTLTIREQQATFRSPTKGEVENAREVIRLIDAEGGPMRFGPQYRVGYDNAKIMVGMIQSGS